MRVGRAPRWRLSDSPGVVLGSLVAGVAVGRLLPEPAAGLKVIVDVYVDLLKMVALPFMVAVVIFSLRGLLADKRYAAMLQRLLLTFLGGFAAAALVGLAASLVVGPGRHLGPDHLEAMGRLAGTTLGGSHDTLALFGAEAPSVGHGLSDVALSLIPANIFAALTRGETLKVMAFSLLFGLAVGRGGGAVAQTLAEVLETVYETCLRLTEWFNRLLPLVLFAMAASQTARTGLEPLWAMSRFLLAIALGSLALLLLSLGTLRLLSGRTWPEVLHSQREPLLMALITRNGHACMPQMIASLVEGLGFPRSRIELLVPLGASLVRLGPVLNIVIATVFIAQLYAVPLGAAQLGVIAAGSMLAGFASSGMNNVLAISLTGLVCNYLRLPFEAAMALFMAVEPVCDYLSGLVEVAGTIAFAASSAGRPPEREAARVGSGADPVPATEAQAVQG